MIYPFHCESQKDLLAFTAHSDTVFPDMEPFDVVYDGDIMRCPGVGDNTSNLAIMMLLAAWFTKNNYVPKCGILFVASSGEEGLGNLKGVRQLMKDYEGKIAVHVALDGSYDSVVTGAVGSLRYRVGVHTEGGHSYGKFGNLNAIQVLSSMIDTLYSYKVPAPGKSTYNVGTITGGTSINTIAQYAEMRFEYRSDVRESLAAMNKYFLSVVDAYRNMDKDFRGSGAPWRASLHRRRGPGKTGGPGEQSLRHHRGLHRKARGMRIRLHRLQHPAFHRRSLPLLWRTYGNRRSHP